jgi:hypothetical protein
MTIKPRIVKALASNLVAWLFVATSALAAAQTTSPADRFDTGAATEGGEDPRTGNVGPASEGARVAISKLQERPLASEAKPTRVLIVVGPSNHPPGTHEVTAGGRLLKYCLENMANLPGVKVDLFNEWPKDQAVRAAADTIVFIGDTFPPNRLPNAEQNLAELEEMMQRGCGIVCVHYATGLLGEDVKPDGAHPLLRWMGGYFAHRSCAHHESFAKIFPEATISPAAPQHPVWRAN